MKNKKMKSNQKKNKGHAEEEKAYFDVVCGMELPPSKAKHESELHGESYYFCSQSCKNHFDADPQKYIG